MNIQQVKSQNLSETVTKPAVKTAVKPQFTQAENKELINEKGAEALKNYFLGTQNIPSFKGFDCKTGEFNRNMMYVPCACCGKKMINGSENVEKLGNIFLGVKGEERLKFIDENMEIFRPVEKVIARGLREVAELNPDKKTSELVTIIARNPEDVMKKGQLAVLEEVDAEAKLHYGDKNEVSKFLNYQKKFITGKENNPDFNRADFVAKMDKLTTKLGDKDAKGKVLNKAIDMPFEEDFFKKMYRDSYNPLKFSRGLFSNAMKTAEHIQPKSLGGPNSTENYMSECNECNENRQNYDLNNYWQTRYPSMPYNVQKYADTVTKQIIDGQIGPHFVDYPKDLKVAIENETQGKIKLTVLNPEEINKKREEKGLKPLPTPTEKNIQEAREAQRCPQATVSNSKVA